MGRNGTRNGILTTQKTGADQGTFDWGGGGGGSKLWFRKDF